MDKVTIGIATYGTQAPNWWSRLALMTGTLHHYGIQFMGVVAAASMATDDNRNAVVKSFLGSSSDWLLWIDTDNVIPLGGVRRLLDTGKTLVSGVYYLKQEPHTPVAYAREPDGWYRPIHDWRRGEILAVDMAGMGCCLTHRSVYEDMQKQLVPVQLWECGLSVLHKDDIHGELPKARSSAGPLVKGGVLRNPVCVPKNAPDPFPWFMLTYGRTEDVHFFEMAARCGHKAWCDTSVEASHLKSGEVTGETYREGLKQSKHQVRKAVEYLDVEVLDARA